MIVRKGQRLRLFVQADKAAQRAVADLRTDFDRVLGVRFEEVNALEQADVAIVNLECADVPGLAIAPGEWERYEIRAQGGRVLIAGSDARGLIYGIYHLCEHALGVDPLWFWADFPPEPRESVDLARAAGVSETPRFKYRGWFINGEDLLIGFPIGPSPLTIRQPHWGVRGMVSYEAYDKILEAMLRLRLNVLIPATFTDIHMPQYQRLFDQIVARGMLITFHHVEPVGVCPGYTFEHCCERKGLDVEFSWTRNASVVEDCWRETIDRFAAYGDQVVWQLGYRGRDDMPFWESEPDAPREMDQRAKVINGAIRRQYEIIRERMQDQDVVCTTTLWEEGTEMNATGLLDYPPNTIRVWSDVGRDQMFPTEMDACRDGQTSGIYYHTSFWSTGPHMMQGNGPENIRTNVERAAKAGATEYFMHHVSNIRPFVFNIRQMVALMRGQDVSTDEHCRAFCEHYYGDASLAELYKAFFAAFVHRSEPYLRKIHARWLDGALYMLATAMANFIKRGRAARDYEIVFSNTAYRLCLFKPGKTGLLEKEDRQSARNFAFDNWADLAAFITPLLRDSLGRWQTLRARVEAARQTLARGHRLFDENLRWQTLFGETLTAVCIELAEACSTDQEAEMRSRLSNVKTLLDSAIARRAELAEQGHFKGWFDGEHLLSLPRLRDLVDELAGHYERELLRSQMAGNGPGTAHRLTGPRDRLDALRKRLWERIGVFPERVDLGLETVDVRATDAGVLEAVRYRLEDGEWVTALVGRPRDTEERLPAIVALHSHGANYAVGKGEIFDTEPAASAREFYGWGWELVARGYVVIAPDQLCFEERRRPIGDDKEADELFETFTRLAAGSSYMAKCAFDSMRAVDVLCERDDVDPNRIGAIGMSGGGAQTLVLQLCDPRVSAGVMACGLSAAYAQIRDTRIMSRISLLPGLTELGDTAAAVAAIAPRAVLIAAGSEDFLFPTDGVLNTFARARQAWEALDRAGRLRLNLFEGPHLFTPQLRREHYDWLDRQLQDAGIPPKEVWYLSESPIEMERSPSDRIAAPYRKGAIDPAPEHIRRVACDGRVLEDVRLTADETRPFHNKRAVLEAFDRPGAYVRQARSMVLETGKLDVSLMHRESAAPKGKRPAVLVLHRGGPPYAVGRDEPLGLAGDARFAVGPQLADAGFLTASVDLVGHGTRRGRAIERTWPNAPARHVIMPAIKYLYAGTSLLDRMLHDVRVVLDYLAARNDVDASKIAVVGYGTGAIIALLAAADDPRVSALCAAGEITNAKTVLRERASVNPWLGHPDLIVAGDVEARVAKMHPVPSLVFSYGPERGEASDDSNAVLDAIAGPQATINEMPDTLDARPPDPIQIVQWLQGVLGISVRP